MMIQQQFLLWCLKSTNGGFQSENSGLKPAEAGKSSAGRKKRIATGLLVGCVFCVLFSLPLAAQNAEFAGTVRDASGAVIPGATVKLTNEATGVVFSRTTDGQGIYAFPSIQPGLYDISVAAQGFESETRSGIDLHVADNLAVNFNLKVGSVSTTVNVRTEAEQMIETSDAATGQVIDRQLMNSMPLLSRSATDLAFLAPGVNPPPGGTYGKAGASSNDFISDGSRNGSSDILIDGITTQQQNTGGQSIAIAYTPSVDAIEEFKVQQTNFSAEYGRTGATITNMVTRSGTNQFHGSAYDYIRNKIFNANNFFSKQAGQPLPSTHRNTFGGTVGGPIFRKRTFFFFDFDGMRDKSPAFYQLGVPSEAEKTGDFGELCTGKGGTFDDTGKCSLAGGQIWDPYTSVLDKTNNPLRQNFIPYNNMATYVSPGVVNPPAGYTAAYPGAGAGSVMDPVSLKIMQGFPKENVGSPGQAGYNPSVNYSHSGVSPINNNQWDLKIDHHFSDTNNISSRYSHKSNPSETAPCFGPSKFDPCTQGPAFNTAHLFSLNYNHVFSNSTVLSANYGLTRSHYGAPGNSASYPGMDSVKDLGMPAYMDDSAIKGYPMISFNNEYLGYQGSNGLNIGSQPWANYAQGQDSQLGQVELSHLRGRHELKFGVDYRFHHFNFGQIGASNGFFAFSYMGSSMDGWSGPGGDAIASFLIGQGGTWGQYNIPAYLATSNTDWAAFAQDNFKMTPKLTVNVGLRYDLTIPMTERYNKVNNLDLTTPNPFGQGFKGGITFPGSTSGLNRRLYDIKPTNFAPRLGVAYKLNDNTVVRSGYGIYFAVSPASASADVNEVQGFVGTTNWMNYWNYNGYTPAGMLRNPFPNGTVKPQGSSMGMLTNLGASAEGPVRTFNSVPYEQSWSFELQRSMPWGLLADASYIGKQGTHLMFGVSGLYNYNHLSDSIIGSTPEEVDAMTTLVPNPNGAAISAINGGCAICGSIPTYWSQMPYQEFNSVLVVAPPWASATYHALQLRAQKKMSDGLTFLATYVWSKAIDNASAGGNGGSVTASLLNPNHLNWERSQSSFNVPQTLQFTYTYALPFGRGQRFAGTANPVVNAIIGGWQTNGVWRFDDGQPISLGLKGTTKTLPTFGHRAFETANLKRASKSAWKPLNSGCPAATCGYFANPNNVREPDDYTFGNTGRTISLTAPGTANASLSMFKSFALSAIHEGSSLEFRLEAFNALNHTQFAAPNTTVGDTANFGKITSQANDPRTGQVALRFYY